MPRFSVIIPTYNRATRLERTIRSVLEQTFADFELLVMDDGSTDETRAVVERQDDARIRYAWAENSGGPATPRNRGLDAARADWMCFLDADDRWYPEKLWEMDQAIAADPTADAFCHDESLVVGGVARKPLTHGPFSMDFYHDLLIKGNRCSTSAMTVRRSFLDHHGLGFNPSPEYVIVEDYDLWLRMAKAGAKFVFLDRILGEYVVESDSISLDMEKLLRNNEVLLRDHVSRSSADPRQREALWNRAAVKLHVARARALAKKGNRSAALWFIVGAFLSHPAAAARYLHFTMKRRSGTLR